MSGQTVLEQLYKFVEIDTKLKEKKFLFKQVKNNEITEDELVLFLDIKSLMSDEEKIINEIGIELTKISNKKILLNNGEELIFWNTALTELESFMRFKLEMLEHRKYSGYSSESEVYYLVFFKEKEKIELPFSEDTDESLKLLYNRIV